MRSRRYASLSIDYLTTNLAYSAVLSMLPIMLTQRVGSASVLSGVMLGVLSAAARGSTLFLGRLIEKISTLWLMQISLAIIVLGLVSFAWLLQVSPVFALLGLMLFGVGISLVNFTLRGHIIATTADSKEQASFFSLATLSANLGAAIGPITASYVQCRLGLANFLIIICLIYAVISVITGICFERHVYLRTSDSPSEEKTSILSTIGTLLSSRRMLPVLLIVVTGSVMNGQLFSGMSLVFHGFSSDLLPSGLFFTVDAIAGIVLQFPHQQAGGMHHGYRKNINVLHGLKPRVVRHRFCAVRSGNVDAIGMVHICCSAGICICGMHVRTVDKCRHGGIRRKHASCRHTQLSSYSDSHW